MKVQIQLDALKAAGFEITPMPGHSAAAVRGHGAQTLGSVQGPTLVLDAPLFLIRGFVAVLEARGVAHIKSE